MSTYRDDADILREYPDLDPELVRRAEFYGCDGDEVKAAMRFNYLTDHPAAWGDVETWLTDFGLGRTFRWAKDEGMKGKSVLWHVVPIPGDVLIGLRLCADEILWSSIQYVRLSELEYFAWEADDELEHPVDLTVVPESWRHRFDLIEKEDNE